MRTVTLEIAPQGIPNQRFVEACNGIRQGEFLTFATPELLFKTLTAKRWEILQMMTGAGAMSIQIGRAHV